MKQNVMKNYTVYCHYTAGNADWGYDALRILTREGLGVKAGVRLPGCCSVSTVYLFESVKAYDEFKLKLIETTLSWHVTLQSPIELSSESKICWTESAQV